MCQKWFWFSKQVILCNVQNGECPFEVTFVHHIIGAVYNIILKHTNLSIYHSEKKLIAPVLTEHIVVISGSWNNWPNSYLDHVQVKHTFL